METRLQPFSLSLLVLVLALAFLPNACGQDTSLPLLGGVGGTNGGGAGVTAGSGGAPVGGSGGTGAGTGGAGAGGASGGTGGFGGSAGFGTGGSGGFGTGGSGGFGTGGAGGSGSGGTGVGGTGVGGFGGARDGGGFDAAARDAGAGDVGAPDTLPALPDAFNSWATCVNPQPNAAGTTIGNQFCIYYSMVCGFGAGYPDMATCSAQYMPNVTTILTGFNDAGLPNIKGCMGYHLCLAGKATTPFERDIQCARAIGQAGNPCGVPPGILDAGAGN